MKRFCSLLLTLALILGLAACGQKPPTWQEQYDLGVKYLSEGNYEEAVIAFTAAIEIDPKKPEAYMGLADVYTAQSDLDSARKALEDGLAATGDSSLQTRLDALDAEETLEEALQGDAPAGRSETVSVEGYLIANPREYKMEWRPYQDQYQKSEENIFCSIAAYGIRFPQPVEVSVGGEQATISEAEAVDIHDFFDDTQLYYDYDTDTAGPMYDHTLRFTGYFYRNEQTEELEGPFERDGQTDYRYRPNGDYCFSITGYEEIG